MPGKNGTAIEIPVNLRAQVANLKQLKETLVKASDEAGKESTLGKQLQKQLQNINSMLSDIDELMISPTIDETGFKQVQGLFDKFFKETNKAFTNIDIASFEQIATPEQIARVKEYHEEIKKLAQERERLEKHGSAERSDTYLTRTGKQDVLTRGKAQKGFDPTASLGKNAENLEKLANQQMQSIASLTEANTQLANEAVAAAAAFQTATQNVNNLKAQRDTLRKDELAATFYHQMGSFDTSVPANANLRRPNIDNIRTGLRKSFNAVATDGGEIITEARDTVASWLQTTFNNVSATEATQMVNQNITTLLEQVMEKIFGDNYRNLDVSYNTDHSALMGNMQQYVRSQAEQLNRAHGTTNALELTTQRQLMDTQVKQAQEIVAKAKTATDKANTKLTENQDALARLETTEANTRLLATELKELAATAREAALAANETAIALKKEEQAEYKENVVNPVKQTGAAGRVLGRTVGASADEALGETGGRIAAGRSSADEAKEFKEHMQQSLKHWMGAQQIVSIVKNGIRQAYQDIKNLDTAMTNIAVVTDMSISDLWGKINEYMSIAQQYGVTTQGVYEVSQLYYQQGLSTNEVMAATTETLKLARIAGMDYKDAADAMTVAIRSFKMEMSDAQHVTDVYSKVAAITASDSQELAVAMSKTASSAESVGSSFENTTAMLAVMVETTRESAQNLGSALKSIISRYGEMKVGLTVDSEGEEIDYNKVDTALKSVGISIKDAQGQFRDFDDVIFELSEKWDSLDKNTQRYIATIMAGNRQQSRFIALVDNWERLEEVSVAAADSADAGLLQYAKTLDSLETKLNNMKTSFQQFYMSIINGPVVAAFMGFIQNILDGFNKLGQWQSLLNVVGLINSVKLIGTLLVSAISGPLAQMRAKWKEHFEEITRMAAQEGKKAGKEHAENVKDTNSPGNWATNTKAGKIVSIGGAIAGTALTAAGTAIAADNAQAGSILSGLGNVANFASMGAALGPWGAAIGAIVGGLASLPAVLNAFDPAKILEEKIKKAEKELQEAEIERAQKKEDARNLEATLENLRKLQEARYDSEEAERAYIEASQTAIEKWPELANSMTINGEQIVDVIGQTEDAELLLLEARRQAAQAALDAAAAENKLNTEKLNQALYTQNQINTAYDNIDEEVPKYEDGIWAWDFMKGYAGIEKYSQAIPLLTQLNDPNSDLSQTIFKMYIDTYGIDRLKNNTENGTDQEIWDWIKNDFVYDLNRVNEFSLIDGESVDVLTLAQQQQSNDAEIRQREVAQSASRKAVFEQYIQTLTLNDNKDWANDSTMNRMASIFTQNELTRQNVELKYNEDGTLAEQSRIDIQSATIEAGKLADEFYDSHFKNLEEMNALTEKAVQGTVSRTDYIKGMEKYFDKSEGEWGEIEKAYIDAYIQRDNQIRANYAKAIGVSSNIDFRSNDNNAYDLSSYDAYLLDSGKQDTAEARYEYNNLLRDELREATDAQGNNIGNFLINASEQQLQEYLALTKEAEKAVDIVGPAGKVAQDRIAHMQKMYLDADAEAGDFSKLDAEAQAEFFRLLNTDAGTHKWAEDLNAFEQQYGVELGEWDKYAFENFSVRTQNIIDNAVSVTDTIKEIGEKHNKGFSWEESQKLLKQIQAIDPSATWTSLFKVTEDGLIVLEDTNETIQQLYQQQSSDLNKQQATINTAIDNFNQRGFVISDARWTVTEEDMPDFAKGLTENILGIQDPELEAQILAGIQSGAIYSYESLMTFLKEQREVLEAAGVYVDAQIEQLQGANAFQTWSSGKVVNTSQMKMEGTLADYGDIWTKKLNQKYDTTNWSQARWDSEFQILEARMKEYGATVDELGNVIWETEEGMVNYFIQEEGYTEQAARDLVAGAQYADWLSKETNTDKLQDAAESFTKELIETGEVAAETVDALVQSIDPNADGETQLAIRNLILDGITKGYSPEEIIANINSRYGTNIDTNMITAIATDSANESTKRFFELYSKWLAGTITKTELLELQSMDVPDNIADGFAADFSSKAVGTIEQYYEYLGAAIKEGNEEILKSARDAAKEATVKELNQIAAGKDESGKDNDVETFQLAGQIDGANGKYSTDMLATLGAETGEFNKEAFQQYFHWDEESQSWLLDAGENMQDALVAIYGEEVPTYIIEAFEASELEERIAKEIEDDNNLTSIPEKFASLISDPLNATLDELVKFWESLLGRELTANEFELVKEARSAAIAGDSEKLHGMLLGWMDYAKAETGMGYDVRWDSIKQASFGTNAQNQANIEKWLKGEGTIDDFEKVWMAEAGKLEGDDLVTFIQNKISSMRGAFIDAAGNLIITDYEEFMSYLAQEGLVDEATLTQYAAEIQDTTLETIKSIFDYINKAIEGTLTATELRDMGQAVVNSGTMSNDEWHTFASQNVSRVGTGYKMNEAAAFALQVNTGNYDFEGLVDQFDSIEEVNEMLEELQENSEEWGNEFVRAAERVLESIKMIKAQDPSDAMFNWMDQDMEGWAGTYESTIGSIGKANDVINASMESGTMGLNDFYNMSHIVASQLEGEQLVAWNKYRDAVYATATTVDGGTVSLTAGGKSMEYALKNMRTSTEAYYQDIAQQQIDFIDKQIAALEAQKKVEEALSAPGGNEDGARANLTRDDFVFGASDYTQKKNADGTLAFDSNGKPIMVLKDTATGIYSADEYGRAEAQWYEDRWGENGADAAARDKGQSFATVMDEHFTSAYRDALKAGLDVTDAQVQRQIKDAAMARAGINGYYDTLQNEELNTLTTISQDVAAIREEVAKDVATTPEESPPPPPPPENTEEPQAFEFKDSGTEDFDNGTWMLDTSTEHLNDVKRNEYLRKRYAEIDKETNTGLADPTGSGNDTANLVDPRIPEKEPGVEEQTLIESQQQTKHQANIEINTMAAVTALGEANSLLTLIENNTRNLSNTDSNGTETTSDAEDSSNYQSNDDSSDMEDFDNGTWMLETGEERVKLLSERQALLDERAALLEENQRLTADITNLEEKIHLLEQDQDQLREERDEAHNETESIQAQLNETSTLLSSTQAALDGANSIIAQNESDIEGLTTDKESLEAEISSLRSTNNDLLGQVKALQDTNTTLYNTNANLQATISSLEAENAELRAQNTLLEEEKVALEGKYVEAITTNYAYTHGYQDNSGQTPEAYTYELVKEFFFKELNDGALDSNEYWNLDEAGDRVSLNDIGISKIVEIMAEKFGELDWQAILLSWHGGGQLAAWEQGAIEQALNLNVDIDNEALTQEALETGADVADAIQGQFDEKPITASVGATTSSATNSVISFRKWAAQQTPKMQVQIEFVDEDGSKIAAPQNFIASATGNVNGLAFATGTEKLIAGAHLANKSLVGELGPELAVYDGQYHLLGANGAEFANIPNDAIIFNHKQTEGILKGQANIRGRVKDGGKAFAEGNISGPAYDTGNIDAAIAALKEARAMWQSLLDRGLRELAGIGSNKGGGGSGNMAKAYSTELQEWYNLLRQIADIEAEINQLVAERTNLQNEYNGEAVARNLRQQQMLLNQQLKTQETLLVYQNAQLKRQAKQINNDKILSQFIEVNDDGIVQYLKGNEAFGGKGTLEVLSQLTDASAKEQLAFIKQIGFDKTEAAYDQDGNLLEGEDLIQAFFDYFDTAINEYDGLQDTVNASTTKLEDIKSNITNINNEIRDNQMELEQNIFDTIVDAWEANIDALEEQKELIEEANDAYVEGLNEALQAERDMYDEQNAIADREQLQRQLSLLRRSGGSASEIADLEAQLDDALKDEYFRTQEDMIKGIEDANKAQIELLEKQITIQEDALEFEKENGVIWQKVADVLSGTKESIMDFFMNGAGEGFFSKSKEQQIDALNEWSYSVGMYKEDQLMKSQAADFANGIVGENANGEGGAKVWETEQLKGHKSLYDELDDSQKQVVHDAYGTAYQQAIGEGKSEDEARAAGYTAVAKQMEDYQAERDAIKNTKNNDDNPDPDKIYDKEDNTGEFAVVRYSSNGNGTTTHANGKTEVTLYAGNTIKPTLTANSGSKVTHWTLNGKEMTVGKAYTLTTEDVSSAGKRINVVGHFGKIYNGIRITTQDGTEMLRDDKVKTIWEAKKKHKTQYPEGEGYQYLGYSQGGLVDYTGPALVHGTKSKPEAFLNAEQTALISEAVQSFSTTGSLTQMRETLASMASSIKGVVSSVATTSNNNSITIAPNAIAIHVDELADSYDVESLSNDIMNRITSIASKAGSRGINRR